MTQRVIHICGWDQIVILKKAKKVNIYWGKDTLFKRLQLFFLNPQAISGSQVARKPCLKIEILPALRFEKKKKKEEDSGLRKESAKD